MNTFLHITPGQQRRIQKIIPYMLIGLLFGTLYAIIEKELLGHLHYYPSTGNSYHFFKNSLSAILHSGFMGLVLGIIEVYFMENIFSRKSFGNKFFLKTFLYITSIIGFIAVFSLLSSSILLNISLSDPIVYKNMFNFFTETGFWNIMLYIGVIFIVTLFLSEMSDHLGQGVLISFLLGKYLKPREEVRIFMFMDLKSSTTMAQKIGHVNYFRFLNEYYADITEAILETGGEIYQYVGDEIIVSWRMRAGLPNLNCLRCFFKSKDIIRSNQEKYLREFGLLPEFKAGIHFGKVTTGRIGVVKKEIVFTGDVLNTAARIQSICNRYHVDNLISGALVEELSHSAALAFKKLGTCYLRGKEDSVDLYTLNDQSALELSA